MVGERNRILELKEYLSELGISVNIGKTKARGHKGIFMHSFNDCRIDISKNVSDVEVLSILLHEFAHYIHYSYDKSLKNLDFVFGDYSDDIREELIRVTVSNVPKEFAANLFNAKLQINNDIKFLTNNIKSVDKNFKLSEKNNNIEQSLPLPYKYLLKYDKVKYFNDIFSADKIDENLRLNDVQKAYIKLKSKQRALRRVNCRISRLNKYYNNPTELFARFIDAYYTKPEMTQKLAPESCLKLKNSNIEFLKKVNDIFYK